MTANDLFMPSPRASIELANANRFLLRREPSPATEAGSAPRYLNFRFKVQQRFSTPPR
jgi:hypothetical protein